MSLLLKSQKNLLFEMIRQFDLSPSDFEWGGLERGPLHDDEAETLTYKEDDKNYFCWEMAVGNWAVSWSPNDDTPHGAILRCTWGLAMNQFALWLRCLKRELEAPDMWASLEEYQRQLASEGGRSALLPSTTNRPFSVPEVGEVKQALGQLTQMLKLEFKLSGERLKHVEHGVRALTHAAEKGAGRIDWSNQMIGFVMSVLLLFAAEPEQAHRVFEFLKALAMGQAFLP